MEKRKMICTVCPNGCALEVETEDGEVVDVAGNTCMRGYIYAQQEVQNPVRTYTSEGKESQKGTPQSAI